MYSIIKRLYGGSKYPREIFEPTEDYKETSQRLVSVINALESSLTPQQIKLLEAVLAEYGGIAGYEAEDAFRVGFCIGARVLMEVLDFDSL